MKNGQLLQGSKVNQKYLLGISFWFLMLLPIVGFTQPKFMYHSNKIDYTLDADQAQEFAEIMAEDEYVDYELITVKSLSQAQQNGNLSIDIPGITCGTIEFASKNVNYFSDNDYWWFGTLESTTTSDCRMGVLTILKNDDGLFGTLSIEDKAYEIRDLSKNAYGIFEVGSDNEYEVCLYGALASASNTAIQSGERKMDNDCSIDMLALVDNKARKKHYKNRIRSMVNTTNSAIAFSQINVPTFKLDILEIMDYDDMDLDQDDIQGDLAELQIAAAALRAEKSADWVVLFTREKYKKDGNKFYGLTAGTETSVPNAPDGFSIVELRKKVQRRLTFTHEFGHIMGAGHEFTDNPTPGPAHAHRLCIDDISGPTLTASTVVHQRFWNLGKCAGSGTRLPMFSNPSVTFLTHPTGSLPTDDNASVIAGNACAVANYETFPLQTMTFYITGPDYACPYGTVILNTVVSGNEWPITWLWELTFDGINYATIPSTQSAAVINLPPFPGAVATIRVTATSPTNTQTNYHTIQIESEWDGQEAPCLELSPGNEYVKRTAQENFEFQVFPNPTKDKWSLDLANFDAAAAVAINLYSANGEKVFHAPLNNADDNFDVDASFLTPGVYFICITDREGVILDSKKVIRN